MQWITVHTPHGDASITSSSHRHSNLKYKYGSRHFWCRGYYVDTVGKSKQMIQEYIRNQLIEDEMIDQMRLKEYVDPFTGSKNK